MSWGYLAIAVLIWAGSFILSIVVVSLLLVSLPPGHFREGPQRQLWAAQHPLIRWTLRVLKNALGFLLVLLGGVLSVPGIPGQGLLTVFVGIILLDFPGKRRLERRILMWPRIRAAVDRLRGHFGRPPLELVTPEVASASGGENTVNRD